ncbi:TM2 domain-containing protein [Flavobacterium sp. NG2]|uniref:TM2 domain-containing protein n=1 Tax=Flavobacterium sp. NG2 TaxID=3097547 RepID=UPI002A7F38B3|nr:TM2 domain-containing protein [Flavobacterium sp. NG2]WPR72120.1 TM2 domain-containing protein [Flavobacterium sp. NG2]
MEHSKHEYWNQQQSVQEDNKRLAAGILAILLAPFGVHKFLLGYNKEGILWLIISAVTFGTLTGFLGIIEGVIYLTKSDKEFYNTYQLHKRKWF